MNPEELETFKQLLTAYDQALRLLSRVAPAQEFDITLANIQKSGELTVGLLPQLAGAPRQQGLPIRPSRYRQASGHWSRNGASAWRR